ncbi:cathelicidin antimicrobial peptide [Pteropus vampyrus]|uniref:Cathelicidin antimicrobial peptide n=1 Tax=Pteropus vampyrus TaxID=132908 RepID=A0A6P3R1S8_PTEVA|nr:cathelicidin antimicrobial peptide [Pteropus vampyrus]
MARAWMALMLVVGLAATACVAQRRLSYEEIVTEALWIFNQGRRGQSLFGLVEAIPPANSNSTTRTKLSFRIKETVCIAGRRTEPRECAFKADGVSLPAWASASTHLTWPRGTFREKRSTESAETASAGADTSKLPPAVRDMYERAKYEIIANILSNF